ncbi:MAG TPA: hypothetical protein VNO50_12740 [Pyrinomonadaceae bacterium]|nr:hypothetical protein [Pyrinomonadaceae bacterium]
MSRSQTVRIGATRHGRLGDMDQGKRQTRRGFGGQSLMVELMTEDHLVGDRTLPAQVRRVGGPELNSLLNRAFSNVAFTHLGNLDAYGLTIFNEMQVAEVLIELELLREFAKTEKENQVLGEVIELAAVTQREHRTSLVFLGD